MDDVVAGVGPGVLGRGFGESVRYGVAGSVAGDGDGDGQLVSGGVGVPDHGGDLGGPLAVAVAADAQGAAATAHVRFVHPCRLVGDDAR
ncbi:hypothetical protein ACWGCI_01380 [Streptomyces sp. NPDC054949]|uniref:hypothetical protein n=1 Tax=unclassified Streptomyces TaxID=2593676 RepID=UPI00224E78F2|nr:hypothetical protein [Streptomyces sp. NBC_00424]MCX5077602.1 hypothetical protein [Streptomyces sp. NBC_00424]WUD39426.1 hypothetical protein OHA84_02405 [Streptomyces sp. NBC_00513]